MDTLYLFKNSWLKKLLQQFSFLYFWYYCNYFIRQYFIKSYKLHILIYFSYIQSCMHHLYLLLLKLQNLNYRLHMYFVMIWVMNTDKVQFLCDFRFVYFWSTQRRFWIKMMNLQNCEFVKQFWMKYYVYVGS